MSAWKFVVLRYKAETRCVCVHAHMHKCIKHKTYHDKITCTQKMYIHFRQGIICVCMNVFSHGSILPITGSSQSLLCFHTHKFTYVVVHSCDHNYFSNEQTRITSQNNYYYQVINWLFFQTLEGFFNIIIVSPCCQHY